MPRPKEPFHLVADRTRRRRVQELQEVVSKELAAPYTVKYLPDTGQPVLTPETRIVATVQPEPTQEERLIMAVWRIRSLHLSRTESRYLVGSMTYGVVWDQVYGMLRQLALPESRAFTAYTGDDTAINGAACYLPDRIAHLFKCRPPPPSAIMQPGDRRLHWLPIAVDGTSRHEASYVHCTLGGTASPNQLSSWWLLGGSEKWDTLYAASQEIDFDDELRKAATISFKDTAGTDRQSLFFLCADGKAQVLMAGCQNWKAESPGATVCWVCMRNRALCLATFGTASAIDGNWEPAVAISAIYRTIMSDRRVPDYGLHGVLRVLLCAVNGTRDLVVQLTGKAPATVARTMLQPVLDEARLAARTCTRASLNNDKANSKGKVRMECAAAIHFMRNKGWEKIIDACLEQPSVRQHQVGGKSWESVCKTWWENFASMCVYAWRSAWFSGADLGRLRNHSIAMGAAHNELQWGKLLWTHLWIDHMYYFAKKWRILSKFSCFAMEGSHRRLKRMLRNSGGLSLLRGRLGVQVVVDNHTIDDSLWLHGWDATKRAQHGQGPISVQTYASRTRRRLLTDMQHLQTLQRRFRCRKRRT